jgi:hypothetical protein
LEGVSFALLHHRLDELSLIGVMLGTIVSLVMFFLARFYLWMGWLPRRR